MNPRAAVLALGVLVAVVAGPALTVHALIGHIAFMGGVGGFQREFGLSVAAVLAVAAVAPLVALGAALPGFARSTRSIARLRAEGRPRTAFGISYIVVESDLVSMFTSGVRRPFIFVTSAAERVFTRDQLKAGLLHERAHQERGDVLTRMILRMLRDAFGWLPGVRAMADAVVVRSECAADRSAVDSGANRLALFDAIVAAAGVAGPEPALGAGQSLIRIHALTDPGAARPAVPRRGLAALAGWQIALPLAAHVATVVGVACTTHF